jgi:acid stress-induced BolA-like protein IbaG/YrbA
MGFEERVRKLIEGQYAGAEVHIDFGDGARKLNGYMVWPGFDGIEMLDRQTSLYSYLRDQLGSDAHRVSILFTYTPDEFALMNAA